MVAGVCYNVQVSNGAVSVVELWALSSAAEQLIIAVDLVSGYSCGLNLGQRNQKKGPFVEIDSLWIR